MKIIKGIIIATLGICFAFIALGILGVVFMGAVINSIDDEISNSKVLEKDSDYTMNDCYAIAKINSRNDYHQMTMESLCSTIGREGESLDRAVNKFKDLGK